MGSFFEFAFYFYVGSFLKLALLLYLVVFTSMLFYYMWLYKVYTICFGNPLDSTILYLGSFYKFALLYNSLKLANFVGNFSELALLLFGSSYKFAFFL